jgi:hypothetical protein
MKLNDVLFGIGVVSVLIISVALMAGLIDLFFKGLQFMIHHPLQAGGIMVIISLAIFTVSKFISNK